MNNNNKNKSKQQIEVREFLADLEEEINQFAYWDICPSYFQGV